MDEEPEQSEEIVDEESYDSAYRLLWGSPEESASQPPPSAGIHALLDRDLEVIRRSAPATPTAGAPRASVEAYDLAGMARSLLDDDAQAAPPAAAPSVTSVQESPTVATDPAMAASSPETEPQATPDGTLVPRSVWAAMLDQLGHLHEAGKELAQAQERAAKAETKVQFLTERVADIRAERDRLKNLLNEFLSTENELSDTEGSTPKGATLLDLLTQVTAERDELKAKLGEASSEALPKKARKRKWFAEE